MAELENLFEDLTPDVDATDDVPQKPKKVRKTAADFFRPIQISAEVVRHTLGVDTDHITPELLMEASKKVLGISRGTHHADDRDSLEYQRVYGSSEYLPEHVQKDGGKVARNILWKATHRGNLDFIGSGALEPHVDSVFNESKLAQYIDGTNMFEALDANSKITRIGEGGVGDVRMAPDEMRTINNSFMGFVDALRFPECTTDKHQVYTKQGWVPIKDITMGHQVLCLVDGREEFHTPIDTHVYDYTGALCCYSYKGTAYEVTPNHRMYLATQEDPEFRITLAGNISGEVLFTDRYNRNIVIYEDHHSVRDFDGKVYCLTVPGGIFYTRMNDGTPFWTGNSLRIGLDSYLAKNTKKGSDGKLYTRMTDARTGEERWVDSVTMARANVATMEYAPGGKYADDKYVPVPRGEKGIVSYVPRAKIDYYSMRPDEMMSLAANTVPYVSGIKEMRAMLGSKHFASTVPLDNPETPWVTVKDPDTGGPIDAKIGSMMGLRKATKAGVVTAVRKDRVEVQYNDGTKDHFELYQNFPNNQKGFIHSTVLVKAGDKFEPGAVLARTNYTNDKGEVANGVNLRTAFVSWNGMNYEDAKVISDYAAKKLASTTMYKTALDLDKSIKLGKANYLGMRPSEYSKEQMDNIDANGLVKVGTTVSKGDPLYVGVRIVPPAPGSFGKRQFEDITETWQHDHPGVVTDVVQTKKGLKVFVKASAPVEEGDKLSNFAGMKGVVAAIIPRDKMPKDEDGNPIDVLESPLGIISRTNSAFSTVMLLSEVARKRKKPYYVDNFPKEDINEFALNEAKKYNVSPTRTLTDPETGRKIRNVQVGSVFVYKQKHMSEGKESARGTEGYNAEDLPSRGGYTGCLHGSTIITTEEGPMTIREIVRNKLQVKVLSWNPRHCKWEYNKVTDWFIHKVSSSRVHKYTLEGGIYDLIATGNHQVYDNFGVKNMIQDYEVGDRIAVHAREVGQHHIIPSRPLKHVSAFPTEKDYVIVYDITVEKVHNYVANNFLVSNSKRIGNMEVAALVSNNAWDVLKDAKLIRGQANQDFWRSIRTGEAPTTPSEPIVYQKFYNHLRAAGVNVKRTNTGVQIMPLTDKEAKELTGARELNSAETFDADTYDPIEGGMFSTEIFGPEGAQWGYIQLDEPLPNPVMEEPLRRILRITQKDFENIVAGKQYLNGKTGGVAIQDALSKIDLKQALVEARQEFKTASKSKKDEALKRYTELARMDKQGTHPKDFMLTRIPVLPAKYRPVMSSGGLTMVSDTNYLYKQMMDARNDLRDVKGLPQEVQGEARAGIYRAWKELTGIIEPSAPKLKQKSVKGLLRWALGTSPKTSAVMQKLVTSTVDTVGRGVVAPDPTLKLDEIGLPKSMAFEVYKPFVTRALVNMNYTPIAAMKEVENQSPVATELLAKVMDKRPVILNRAPTLHRLSMMGLKPKVTAGHIVRVNPSIVSGLAMDFDGDSVGNLLKLEFECEEIIKNLSNKDLTFSINGVLYGKDNNPIGESDMFNNAKAGIDNGFIRLEDLPVIADTEVRKSDTVTEWDVVPGYYTTTVDPDTGAIVRSPITKVSRHEGLKMYDCIMDAAGYYGACVTASEDHSLITLNPVTVTLEKTKPQDSTGRMIPRVMTSLMNDPDNHNRYMTLGKQVHMSYNLGVFIGTMIGDGWVDNNNAARIACDNPEFREYLLDLLSSADNGVPVTDPAKEYVYNYGEGTRISNNDAHRITVYMDSRAKYDLKQAIGSGAENKRIPYVCFGGSRAHMIGVLVGLLATDGTVRCSGKSGSKKAVSKQIKLDTVSPYLRDGIQVLCSRLGIKTSVTPYMGPNSKHTCYLVNLCIPDVVRCYRENTKHFNIPVQHKQEALEMMAQELETSKMPDRSNIVPFPVAVWGVCSVLGSSSHTSALSKARNNGYLNRDVALQVISEVRSRDFAEYAPTHNTKVWGCPEVPTEELHKLFDRWAGLVEDRDIQWVKVTAVTESSCTEGWDCTVPGPYTFSLWDGTVVQDTANIHVPVSNAAVQDVYNKMMPQKHLISVRKNAIQYPLEKEYRQGIYLASRMKSDKAERTVDSLQEAIRMYNSNEIDIDTPIEIRKR